MVSSLKWAIRNDGPFFMPRSGVDLSNFSCMPKKSLSKEGQRGSAPAPRTPELISPAARDSIRTGWLKRFPPFGRVLSLICI